MIGKWSIGTGRRGGLVSARRSTSRVAPTATGARGSPASPGSTYSSRVLPPRTAIAASADTLIDRMMF
ncbi:MAG: hypothetical protein ACRDOI_32140 [Trebonia sp.]